MFLLVLIALFAGICNGFYLPGVAPTTYTEGDNIPLLVNHLTPSLNYQHQDQNGKDIKSDKEHMLYGFDYYYPRLHFCTPEQIVKQPESLGSILFGDRIYNSPFELHMLKNVTNVKLCKTSIPGKDAKFINKLIKNGFSHNWLIDGLPAARKMFDVTTNSEYYNTGFPLGFVVVKQAVGGLGIPAGHKIQNKKNDKREAKNVRGPLVHNIEFPYLANHFDINVEYHNRGNGDYRVVGITVDPYSFSGGLFEPTSKMLALNEEKDNVVQFTYSVRFLESETVWATRWDKYLHVYDPTIQWFSLINFTVVVLCLSSIVVYKLLGALKSDFARYENFNLDSSFQEDSGWKLGHGEIFRIPEKSMVLSILVGSGMQIFLMIASSILLAAVGIISPSSRGSLPSAMFIFYALFGFCGSYTSMGVYKFFHGPYWKANMILTPILVPGSLFLSIIGLNFFLLFVHSSGAIPTTTFLFVLLIWFIISLPLSFAGSLIANKSCHWDEHPTKTSEVERKIPPQPWFLNTLPATLIAGIFPFGCVAVELYFIYTSLWFNKIFYMFGFLCVSFLLLTMTTSLVTILITYHSLCLENWKWHWRSFAIGGVGCSFYIFLHSLLFTRFKLGGFTTTVLYLGYSMIIAGLCCIVTGAIGFLSSMFFIRKLYSSVRVD